MTQAAKTKKIFDGRYEILSIVGRGSRSVVYHARHVNNPSAEVALKVLLEQKGKNPSSDQLRKEALALVSSRHKYVVRLDDFHSVGSLCYLSMEFAPESDLRRYLAKHGNKLPVERIERFLMQAAEGLAFVHKAGIIHRDIKPDNMLVMNDKEIRLADFGVAVLPGETASLDELKNGIGTLNYLAPEVLEGVTCDERSDVFSLGVTFYEVLSGVSPFENVPLIQMVEARRQGNYPPLSMLAPHAPAYLCRAIEQAMSFRPEDRFSTARDMMQALLANRADARFDESSRELSPGGQEMAAARAEEPAARPAIGREAGRARLRPKEEQEAVDVAQAAEPLQATSPRSASAREATIASQTAQIETSASAAANVEPSAAVNMEPRTAENTEPSTATKIEPSTATEIAPASTIEEIPSPQSPDARSEDASPAPTPPPEGAFIPVDQTVVVSPPKSIEEARKLAESIAKKTREAPLGDKQPQRSEKSALRERKKTASLTKDDLKKMRSDAQDAETAVHDPAYSAPMHPERERVPEGRNLRPANHLLRPLIFGFLIAFLGVFVVFGIGSFFSGVGKKKSPALPSEDKLTVSLPRYTQQEFTFPEIPTGVFKGSISGLVLGKSVPLIFIADGDKDSLVVIVGIEGFSPVTIAPRALRKAQGIARDMPLTVASNGTILSLRGINDEGVISGFFTNLVTRSKGEWAVEPVSDLMANAAIPEKSGTGAGDDSGASLQKSENSQTAGTIVAALQEVPDATDPKNIDPASVSPEQARDQMAKLAGLLSNVWSGAKE